MRQINIKYIFLNYIFSSLLLKKTIDYTFKFKNLSGVKITLKNMQSINTFSIITYQNKCTSNY